MGNELRDRPNRPSVSAVGDPDEVGRSLRPAPLALSARELAGRLGVSLRHVRRMDSAGMLPRPCRLGRAVRWPTETIDAWLRAGAPDRRRWEQVEGDGRRSGR